MRVEFLDNTRKGFYCLMCSLEGQDSMYTTWKIFRWLYNRRVYYHRDFCLLIVAHTETTSYDLYKNFNRYLRKLLKLLTCVERPTENSRGG